MKIVGINAVSYGSTGTIMRNIAEVARKHGDECYTFSKRVKGINPQYQFHKYISNNIETQISSHMSAYTGFEGIWNVGTTIKLISSLKKINPDIIHLHNLHGWYLNFPILFRYIRKKNIKVVWTLHDCWAFTAKCPYFDMVNCSKWKTQCGQCPQIREYPHQKVDQTRRMYSLKQKWFNNLDNLTIVTPSKWLGDLVKGSYLKNNKIKIINNGIDLEIFKHRDSDFREKHLIKNKKIILGVASDWGVRKGIDVFEKLAQSLEEDYKIVLVGLDSDEGLSDKILTIPSTNAVQLAEIYSAADVFVNPTREDNYPTVNLEALACGTPIITFKTGGSPEPIEVTKFGLVVEKDDFKALKNAIKSIFREDKLAKPSDDMIKQFDKNNKFEEYYELYKTLIGEENG